ncbi:MAG: hypothetical protein L3K25_14415 [Gammaproteobacteria bacterium]|nr:hypothetical protein [Gammaproteobacteria bacterium]
MKSNSYLFGATFLAATLLAACGGGAGSDTPTIGAGGGGGATGSGYLFYSGLLGVGGSNSGVLYAVDPANPTSPVAVEAGENAIMGTIRTIRSGSYNGTTQTISDAHSYALIYAKTDGRFYRISALKSGSLTPVQVSNESKANQLCTNVGGRILLDGDTVISDLANPDNSQYVYSLPGMDNNCGTGDDEWKMIRLGMGAGDAPVHAKLSLQVLTDYATGAISGWMVNDAGGLKHCDANFANCGVSVTSIVSDANVLLEIDILGQRYLMEIDDQLFVYDANTKTLSAPLLAISSGSFVGSPVTDGTMVYFSYETSVYQIPVDGSSMAVEFIAETDRIAVMELTDSKVIYQIGAEIKSVDKTGGPINLLVSAASDDNVYFFITGSRIYYSIFNTKSLVIPMGNDIIKAGIVDENGNVELEFLDAAWVGTTFSTSFDLNDSINRFDDPVGVILAEGDGNDFSGATLKLFDAASGVESVTLGTLPTSADLPTFFCGGYENNVLCSASVNITPAPALPALPFQSDVFFINSATAGSLARVTNTGDKNEAPLFF